MARLKECSPRLDTFPGFDPKHQESQRRHRSARL